MARTPSTMVALGTEAPAFCLPEPLTGKTRCLEDLKGSNGTLVMFICNHCPYVKHINSALVELAMDYKDKNIGFAAISSNDAVTYPEDGPNRMKETALNLGYPFPYLYDEKQQAAHSYQAACTPDFFLYDNNLRLVYRGQLDDSRPGNTIPVTGYDLRHALEALISGKQITELQKPSIGCNIKWKNP